MRGWSARGERDARRSRACRGVRKMDGRRASGGRSGLDDEATWLLLLDEDMAGAKTSGGGVRAGRGKERPSSRCPRLALISRPPANKRGLRCRRELETRPARACKVPSVVVRSCDGGGGRRCVVSAARSVAECALDQRGRCALERPARAGLDRSSTAFCQGPSHLLYAHGRGGEGDSVSCTLREPRAHSSQAAVASPSASAQTRSSSALNRAGHCGRRGREDRQRRSAVVQRNGARGEKRDGQDAPEGGSHAPSRPTGRSRPSAAPRPPLPPPRPSSADARTRTPSWRRRPSRRRRRRGRPSLARSGRSSAVRQAGRGVSGRRETGRRCLRATAGGFGMVAQRAGTVKRSWASVAEVERRASAQRTKWSRVKGRRT